LTVEDKRFCPQCGRRGVFAFCPDDGTETRPLVADGASVPPVPVAPEFRAVPESGWIPSPHRVPMSQPPRRKGRALAVVAVAVLALVPLLYWSLSGTQQPTTEPPPTSTQYGITASLEVSCGTPVTQTGEQGRNVAFCVTRSSVPLDRVGQLEIVMTDTSDVYGGSQTRATICQDGIPIGTDSYCSLVYFYSCSGPEHTYEVQAKLYGANNQGGTYVDASYVGLSTRVRC